MSVLVNPQLSYIRHALIQYGAKGVLVPHDSAYQQEFLCERDQILSRISGFSGSAGQAYVSDTDAVLFLDQRYADDFRQRTIAFQVIDLKNRLQWLENNIAAHDLVCYPEHIYTINQAKLLKKIRHISWRGISHDAFLKLFMPTQLNQHHQHPCFSYETSRSCDEKAAAVIQKLEKMQVDALILTRPDQIAWLLNIRSRHIASSPSPLIQAIIYKTGQLELFTDPMTLIDAALLPAWVTVLDKPLHADLSRIKKTIGAEQMLLDPAECPVVMLQHFNECILAENPLKLIMACNTQSEIDELALVHLQDSAILVRFLSWLSDQKYDVTELEASAYLDDHLRRNQKGLVDLAFETISAAGSNAAICHYKSSPKTNKRLCEHDVYLCDSGGHYVGGTTDVTRTIKTGANAVDPIIKKHFTHVLQAHIALAMAIFPTDTPAGALDTIARSKLWKYSIDCPHAIGHGIDTCLNVHAQIPTISMKSTAPVRPGMIITNEPGYYALHKYGIRIESDFSVYKIDEGFCGIKCLTQVPIDQNLIEISLLNEIEKHWVNEYHLCIRNSISGILNTHDNDWLERVTKPL